MTKKFQFRFAAAMASALLATSSAWAQATYTVNGTTWQYNYNSNVGAWEIQGIASGKPQGAVTIPSSLGGKTITRFSTTTFKGETGITSVTIPNSITVIADYAFKDCTSLSSVTLSSNLTEIGSGTFQNCPALTSVAIPSKVTKIEYMAFACSGLKSVTIPSKVAEIGDRAFSGCSGLKSVTFQNDETLIGEYAFEGCTSLTSVNSPNALIKVNPSAFYNSAFGAKCFRVLSDLAMNGKDEPPDPRYALAAGVADRSIATVTVNGNRAIDSFVLTDGKVFDTVLRVINVATTPSTLSLPWGYSYERLKGTDPLSIPASSTNLLTITRTADRVFFVAREELESAQ